MMAVLTFLALALSFAGYAASALWIGMRREFIPVVVCSSIGCVIYICGIFGVLRAGAYVVLSLGIALLLARCVVWLIHTLRERSKADYERSPWRWKPQLFDVLFLAGVLVFVALLSFSHLEHYDNYSHWAVALKQMLLTDSFPQVGSDLISFKNYPLGTTSFLYYVCLFAGHSQAMMIIGQSLLIFSCIYALFGIISERGRFLLYAFLAFGCSVLSFFNLTIRINNLLVDFLLPLFALAIIAIAYGCRDRLVAASFMILPVAAFLMTVKLTGVIFAAIGLLYLIYVWFTQHGWRRWPDVLAVFGISVASFGTYALWQWHMAVTGIAELSNKFNIGTSGAATTDSAKSQEQIAHIVSAFVRAAVDFGTRPVWGLLIGNVAVIVTSLAIAFFSKWKWQLWKALIALDLVVVLYYIGILGMYVYSMPESEASSLAGFDRYANSIVVLFVGALMMCATTDIQGTFHYRIGDTKAYQSYKSVITKDIYQKSVVACVMLSLAILLSEFNGLNTIIREYPSSMPAQVERVVGDNWPKHGTEDTHRYLLYGQDSNGQVTDYYMQYVAKYYLYAPHVDAIVSFYEANMDHLISSYDYLVVIEPDAREQALLRKHYGVSGDEGFYRVVKSSDGGIALLPATSR